MSIETPRRTGDFEILVTTHNKLELTIQCINALYQNTRHPFHLTILDESDDLTPQWARDFAQKHDNCSYVDFKQNKPKNANHLWRMGLDYTMHDIVVYIVNSAFVEPEWDTVPIEAITQNPKVGLVGIKLLNFPKGDIWHAGVGFANSFPYHVGINEPGHRRSHIREIPCVNPSVGIFRKSAILEALDTETYIGWRGFEDTDICLSLRNKGWKIMYCGVSSAYHLDSPTRLQDNPDQQKFWQEYNENYRRLLQKWQGRQDLMTPA